MYGLCLFNAVVGRQSAKITESAAAACDGKHMDSTAQFEAALASEWTSRDAVVAEMAEASVRHPHRPAARATL